MGKYANLGAKRRNDDPQAKKREDQDVENARRRAHRNAARADLNRALMEEDENELCRAIRQADVYDIGGLQQARLVLEELGGDPDLSYATKRIQKRPAATGAKQLKLAEVIASGDAMIGTSGADVSVASRSESIAQDVILTSERSSEAADPAFIRAHQEIFAALQIGKDWQKLQDQPRLGILVGVLKLPPARKWLLEDFQPVSGQFDLDKLAHSLYVMLVKYSNMDIIERRFINQLAMRGHGPSILCTKLGIFLATSKKSKLKITEEIREELRKLTHEDLAEFITAAKNAGTWTLAQLRKFRQDFFCVLDRVQPILMANTRSAYNRKWTFRLVVFTGGALLKEQEVQEWDDLLGPLVEDHIVQAYPEGPKSAALSLGYSGPLLLFQAALCTALAALKELRKNLGSWECVAIWLAQHRESLKREDTGIHPLRVVRAVFKSDES